MADRVATIKGTFLVPTVSKNNRLYTKENIGKAVERMNARLSGNEDLPLTMFPSHGTADTDNALMTIGRVTKVNQENDGSATFEADIADTTAGRDMAALVTPENPYIKGLSIRGQWMSQPVTVERDGVQTTTADDLDVHGIDWTAHPGVEGAQITQAMLAESVGAENAVFETAEASFFFDETATAEQTFDFAEAIDQLQTGLDMLAEAGNAPGNGKKPYGNTTYADPGYKSDKQKRYPIDTAAHCRAAWSYINVAKNHNGYTPAQVASIKTKIKRACKKFGIKVTEELDDLTEDFLSVLEAYASMNISNGAGSISASGYTDDAGKLAPMARRIAMATIIGLNALDPDGDGDIDLVMPDGTSDSSSSEAIGDPNDNMEDQPQCTECGGDLPENALFCPTCANPVPNAETVTPENITPADAQIDAAPNEKEAPVADETQTATAETVTSTDAVVTPVAEATAPQTVTLTSEQFQALLGAVSAKPVEAAPVEPVEPVEEAAPITKADFDAALEAMRVETEMKAVEAIRAAGIIPRQGFVAPERIGQFGTPAKETVAPTLEELSKMTDSQLLANSREAFETNPIWNRLINAA